MRERCLVDFKLSCGSLLHTTEIIVDCGHEKLSAASLGGCASYAHGILSGLPAVRSLSVEATLLRVKYKARSATAPS